MELLPSQLTCDKTSITEQRAGQQTEKKLQKKGEKKGFTPHQRTLINQHE